MSPTIARLSDSRLPRAHERLRWSSETAPAKKRLCPIGTAAYAERVGAGVLRESRSLFWQPRVGTEATDYAKSGVGL
jgi:hypothetical protein